MQKCYHIFTHLIDVEILNDLLMTTTPLISCLPFPSKVIGAAGGPEKCDLVRSKGAVECIDYTTENIRDRTKELTDGNGVNVALDAVGGDVWKQCLKR